MAITGIITETLDSNGYAIGIVGNTYTIRKQGEPEGNEVRFYVYSGPINSTLETIETLETFKEQKEIKLKTDDAGNGLFVPDVPGQYTLYCYDVTVTKYTKTFGGEEITTPDSDNEDSVTPVSLTFFAKQIIYRNYGITPNECKVSVHTYDEQVDQLLEYDESVVIEPINDTLAANNAISHPDVVQVHTELGGVISSLDLNLGWSRDNINTTITNWNLHIGATGLDQVHGSAGSHVTAVSDCTSTATAITLLNDIKSKYASHRVDISGTPAVHSGADSTNVVSAANATDFDSAVTLLEDINQKLYNHATSSSYHLFNASSANDPGDGQVGELIITPSTEGTLVIAANKLKSVFNGHVVKVTSNRDVHPNIDSENKVKTVGVSNANEQGVISIINAFADSVYRHGHNLDSDGAYIGDGSAYHIASSVTVNDPTTYIPFRAGNMSQAMQLFEICSVVAEKHMMDVAIHSDGGHSLGRWRPSTNRSFQLQKAWMTATALTNEDNVQVPNNFNSSAYKLSNLYGWETT